jgi:hypothetical protein
VRLPGFEPGLQAWEAYVITTGPQPLHDNEILMYLQAVDSDSCVFQYSLPLMRYSFLYLKVLATRALHVKG